MGYSRFAAAVRCVCFGERFLMQVGRPERTGPLTMWDLLGDDVQASSAVHNV
jgi:hypothetical protein